MLSRWNIWTDRSFVTTVRAIFDMVWYRGANKHKSPVRHSRWRTVSHLSRQQQQQGPRMCVLEQTLATTEPDIFAVWFNGSPEQNKCMEACKGWLAASLNVPKCSLILLIFFYFVVKHYILVWETKCHLIMILSDPFAWRFNMQYLNSTSRCLSFSSEVSFIFCSSVCACVWVCVCACVSVCA